MALLAPAQKHSSTDAKWTILVIGILNISHSHRVSSEVEVKPRQLNLKISIYLRKNESPD